MEIKYTLEILTKDIQDIEKLVGNLQNSPDGSILELDLALSKLRNVYDILTVIRTDMALEGLSTDSKARPPAGNEKPSVAAEEPAAEEKEPVSEKEKPAAEEKEPVSEKEKPAAAEKEPVSEKEKPSAKKDEPPAEIIAEKFESGSSINENMAGNREPDMDSKLMGQPIESISRNIGINDRFLIIRELFEGDSDGFGKLIEDLDKAGDLKNATRLLEKQFDQVPDHEGIFILTNLVKRRYNRD